MNSSDMFTLSDGRRLSFAEYGAGSGTSILFCHGTPGSRWQVNPGMAKVATALGVRVIVPERPGYGLSDNQPGRTLLDWTKDASELMGHLAIDRFRVLGYSMGGIYALACGHALPARVAGITLVGSIAPNVLEQDVISKMSPAAAQTWQTARDNPEGLAQFAGSLADAPEQLFDALSASLASCDKEAIANVEIRNGFLKDCEESLRNGGDGLVRDFVLGAMDGEFPLENIKVPVTLWHGAQDVNAPVAMAEHLMRRLPRCSARLLQKEGHLCLFSHWGNLLQFHQP